MKHDVIKCSHAWPSIVRVRLADLARESPIAAFCQGANVLNFDIDIRLSEECKTVRVSNRNCAEFASPDAFVKCLIQAVSSQGLVTEELENLAVRIENACFGGSAPVCRDKLALALLPDGLVASQVLHDKNLQSLFNSRVMRTEDVKEGSVGHAVGLRVGDIVNGELSNAVQNNERGMFSWLEGSEKTVTLPLGSTIICPLVLCFEEFHARVVISYCFTLQSS